MEKQSTSADEMETAHDVGFHRSSCSNLLKPPVIEYESRGSIIEQHGGVSCHKAFPPPN